MLDFARIDEHDLRRLLEAEVARLPLTPRLRDIFFAIGAGQRIPEIARSLGISRHTVQTEMKLRSSRLDVSGHRAIRSIAIAMLMDVIKRDAPPPPKTEHES